MSTRDDSSFFKLAGAWAESADSSAIRPRWPREQALREARDLLASLQGTNVSPPILDDSAIEIVRAACALLLERSAREDMSSRLGSASALYDFVAKAKWPDPDFEERAEILANCSFAGWRISRQLARAADENTWLARFSDAAAMPSPLHLQLEAILSMPIPERLANADELHLDDPEMLLALISKLAQLAESNPKRSLEETTFLYKYLEGLEVRFPADPILYDEKEYFLGEAARLAGASCRVLSRRDDARLWFELAEAWFLATENSSANIARLAYQRLALRTEEREFATVLKLIPHLIANLERLGMHEDALKARLLGAVVLKETNRFSEAADAFLGIIEHAKALKNDRILGWAYVDLAQLRGFLGDAAGVSAIAADATPLLRRLGNHSGLAKLQWGVGYLLRKSGLLPAAIEAFRKAQAEFTAIEMHADVAAVHLVLADLLLDANQPAQAEWEIWAALPIIEEYKLVPEGIAAVSLLRDSLRRRQIDRQALRNLHGYFRSEDN